MGIKSDWEEARKLWASSTILMKLLILISLFITTSSIASLSETVFKWKSFILDGVTFYHRCMVDPTAQPLSSAGLQYSRVDVNVLFLVSLYAGSYFRAIGITELWSDFKSKPISEGAVYLCFLSVYIWPGITKGNGVSYSILAVYSIALIYSFVIVVRGKRDDPETFLKFIFIPLFSISLVLLLGAISSGLSK